MPDRIEAFRFGPAERALFGVYHPAGEAPQAAVLMCPPLLHEHVRSHRFFAGLARMLTTAGVACLRFDYHGTGDADGESAAFRPARVGEDLAHAAGELRTRADGAPLILMGVRASALFARAHAADLYASALWLWQPVFDAAGYLRELEALDAAERSSRLRYPFTGRGPGAEPDEVVGFGLAPGFGGELCAYDGTVMPEGVPVAWLDDVDALQSLGTDVDAAIPLPAAVTGWTGQIELESLVPVRAAQPAVDVLLSDMAMWA